MDNKNEANDPLTDIPVESADDVANYKKGVSATDVASAKLYATKIQLIPTEKAPEALMKLPEIALATPKINNAAVSLQVLNIPGITIVQWEIGRGGKWSAASDMFVVQEVKES